MARVMLALSTFRRSDRAVELALEKAREGALEIVFVADRNVERYLVGTDIGLFPGLEEQARADLLQRHRAEAESAAGAIAEEARRAGIGAATHVEVGRFAEVCLRRIQVSRPDVVVTTRSKRPAWMRRLFGSPVDRVVAEAGCPVVEA